MLKAQKKSHYVPLTAQVFIDPEEMPVQDEMERFK